MAKGPPFNAQAAISVIEQHIDDAIDRVTDNYATTLEVDLSPWYKVLKSKPAVARTIENIYTQDDVGWSSAKITTWEGKPGESDGARITLSIV